MSFYQSSSIFLTPQPSRPFQAGNFAYFHARRFYKYKVMKQDADDVEKEYTTRLVLKLSETQWENLLEGKREEMLKKELWFDANRDVSVFICSDSLMD